MAKFRDGLVGPTLILFTICLIITLLLALTYQTTKPIIAEAEIKAANEARAEVLAGATDFTEITGVTLPDGVVDAYKADNGIVFKSGAKGFGGIVTYMIAYDNNGEVVGIMMFDQKETPGLGTKVGNPEYLKNYYGKVDVNSVDAVTGATVTTKSLKAALTQANEAYELVKGAA